MSSVSALEPEKPIHRNKILLHIVLISKCMCVEFLISIKLTEIYILFMSRTDFAAPDPGDTHLPLNVPSITPVSKQLGVNSFSQGHQVCFNEGGISPTLSISTRRFVSMALRLIQWPSGQTPTCLTFMSLPLYVICSLQSKWILLYWTWQSWSYWEIHGYEHRAG